MVYCQISICTTKIPQNASDIMLLITFGGMIMIHRSKFRNHFLHSVDVSKT